MPLDHLQNTAASKQLTDVGNREAAHNTAQTSYSDARGLGRIQGLFNYLLNQVLGLHASTSDIESLKGEQSGTLAATALLFSAIGINSVVLILLDFRHRVGLPGLSLGLAIVALYVYWMSITWSWFRARQHSSYIFMSIRMLVLQGVLWGLLVNYLASIASVEQQNIVTAIIMALVSTPMLGAPFSAAMAFWLPMMIAAVVAIWSMHQLFDVYLLLCFAGYLAFTFGGMVFINRTLLERSIGRVQLQQQNETIGLFLRDYEEGTADWMWETDVDQRLRRVPVRLARLLASSCAALEGMKLDAALGLRTATHLANWELASALNARAAFRDHTIRLEVGHEIRWWRLTGRPVTDDRGRYKGYRGVGSDVTEAHLAEKRIQQLASYDTLTGLLNRQMFNERLELACNRAANLTSGQPAFALLLLDLDRFKAVNDDFGHATGDALLVIVGERLRKAVRETDVVARLGGDEFAITLGSGSMGEAVGVAERLILELSQTIQIEENYVTVGASFGIAMYPGDGATPKDLLRNVDLALYSAKERQRGTYRFFEPGMIQAHQDQLALQADLQHAAATEQMHVVYQPIFDMQTGKIASVEALMRWNHPTRGAVPPSVFIPLAEECGLISQIGEYVLDQACQAASHWPENICVSVNLSSIQFGRPELVSRITQSLQRSNVSPVRLELEITESTWLAPTQQTLAHLKALDHLGVQVVMDDFGTGYSSLSSLQEFQFDGLKIDAKFIRDLEQNTKTAAIVRTIARLAAEVGMSLTAEGVETADQLAILHACGVKRAQGFLFGRPQPEAEVLATVRSNMGISALTSVGNSSGFDPRRCTEAA